MSLLLLKSILYTSILEESRRKEKRMRISAVHKNRKICRVCFEQKGEIPIYNSHQNIAIEIKNFSGVIINREDHLPKHICKYCLSLLNGCIKFRDMCQRNNKQLVEITKKEAVVIKEDKSESLQESDNSYNVPSPFSEENWKCTKCKNQFYDMVSYDKHTSKCNSTKGNINKEEIKKKFLCDICGATAHSNANLLAHKSTHQNSFPYKCDECPYQGRTSSLLKVHKKSHLADKPYKCTQCPKSTTTASNLASHMQRVHNNIKQYKCTYCGKAFSCKLNMNKHTRNMHLGRRTFDCDECPKKFSSREVLRQHQWKIHKVKMEKERNGRLPAYLLCQRDDNEFKMNECDSSTYISY